MRPNTTDLAVACDDGCVRLFSVADGGIEYDRALSTSDGRVLSLAWHPTDNVLFSGTANGTILGWDVDTRRAEVRIEVEALGKTPTVVWSLVVLSDFTVVSGDSLGHVQIWDGRMGTLVHTFSQHKADVLALAATNGGVIPQAATSTGGAATSETPRSRRPRSLRVFSAGMDGLVAAMRRVASSDGGPCRWVKAGGHHSHSHDALTVTVNAAGVVASGGLDSQLCVVDTADVGYRQPRKYVWFCPRTPRICPPTHATHALRHGRPRAWPSTCINHCSRGVLWCLVVVLLLLVFTSVLCGLWFLSVRFCVRVGAGVGCLCVPGLDRSHRGRWSALRRHRV